MYVMLAVANINILTSTPTSGKAEAMLIADSRAALAREVCFSELRFTIVASCVVSAALSPTSGTRLHISRTPGLLNVAKEND